MDNLLSNSSLYIQTKLKLGKKFLSKYSCNDFISSNKITNIIFTELGKNMINILTEWIYD